MRRHLVVFTCAFVCALVAAPALASPQQPLISGIGVGFFPPEAGPFANDQLRLAVYVSVDASGRATGAFTGSHQFAGGGTFARIMGVIDCARKVGNSVIMTGTILRGFDIRGIDVVGEKVSIGVTEGNPDTMGLDVAFVPFPHDIPSCTHRPLLTVDVIHGDFTIY